MKTKLILFGSMLVTLASFAQTNSIVFPLLRSNNGDVLLTNAEFRGTLGNKLFFQTGPTTYRTLTADQISTNDLLRLQISPAQLWSNQFVLDARAAAIKSQAEVEAEAETVAAIPQDDFYNSATNQLMQCETGAEMTRTVNRLMDSLDTRYAEIIDNAEIHDASFDQINDLQTECLKEKKKVLTFALALEKQQMTQAQAAASAAKSNLDNFNADPINYMKQHP
jgi:hypothetical protein